MQKGFIKNGRLTGKGWLIAATVGVLIALSVVLVSMTIIYNAEAESDGGPVPTRLMRTV